LTGVKESAILEGRSREEVMHMGYVVVDTLRQAERLADAGLAAGALSRPTICLSGCSGYRVGHSDIGHDWWEAIIALLDSRQTVTSDAVRDIVDRKYGVEENRNARTEAQLSTHKNNM
jgi:hypothetical protein